MTAGNACLPACCRRYQPTAVFVQQWWSPETIIATQEYLRATMCRTALRLLAVDAMLMLACGL
jgi:hypothetical protein